MFMRFLKRVVIKIRLFFWHMFFKIKFTKDFRENFEKYLWEDGVLDDLIEKYNKHAFSKMKPSLLLKSDCYKKYKYVVLDISDDEEDAHVLTLTSDKSEKIKEKYKIGDPSSTFKF